MRVPQLPFFFLFFLLVAFIPGKAQVQIQGTVTELETGTSLPGVTVLVKNTTIGTFTDINGTFSLAVNQEPPFSLEFSFISYQKQEIEITESNTELNIVLKKSPYETQEVIVIGSREKFVQEIPMTIAVINQKFVERSPEMNDPGDLIPYVPGFSGKNYSSAGSWYTIRGINTNVYAIGAESKIAIFHDHAYNGRTPSAGRSFFDVERVEIYKGPQGPLFSRNATAGVINITSNEPRFYKDLAIDLQYGNWGQKGASVVFNYPFSDKFAVRYAGKWKKRDGVLEITNFDNHQNGKEDILANRLSFLWRPNHKFNALLKLEQQSIKGGGWPIKSINPDVGGTPDLSVRRIELDIQPFDDNEFRTASLSLNWVFNDSMTLSSNTSFNDHQQDFLADLDGAPAPFLHLNNPNEFTNVLQEIRFEGKKGKMDWLLGGSYYREEAAMDFEFITSDSITIPIFFQDFDYCVDNPECINNASEFSRNQGMITSYAVYGNFNYAISSKFNATLGLRYTIDKKELDSKMDLGTGAFYTYPSGGFNIQGPIGKVQGQKTWNGFQPSLILDYKFQKGVMAYANYSRGYLAGGFNFYTANSFKEETNNAFEIGFKSSILKDKIKFNLATYFIDHNDLQIHWISTFGVLEINNAKKVESKGVELETSFNIAKGLDIHANFAFNEPKYIEYITPENNGQTPGRSPKTQTSIIAQFVRPIKEQVTISTRIDYSYHAEEFHGNTNAPDLTSPAYGLLNGTVSVDGLFKDRVGISLYAFNITNVDYIVDMRSTIGAGNAITPGLPRLFGVKLKWYNIIGRK